jgi:ABC-2 type transport system permease protein
VNRLSALGRFEVLRLVRNWKFLAITTGFPVIFYMLFLSDRKASRVVAGTVPWRVYLMVSMCSFGGLVAGLTAGGARLAAERASGWSRQLRVTPVPAWSYVATKVAASMIVILPVLVLVEVVGVTFGGVHESLGSLAELTAMLWFGTLPFAVLGVLIGFLVSTEAAFPVVTALMFILGYFGGLFNPVGDMPRALQVGARLLPSFHLDALGLAVLDGRGFGAVHWIVLVGYAAVLGLIVVARQKVDATRSTA